MHDYKSSGTIYFVCLLRTSELKCCRQMLLLYTCASDRKLPNTRYKTVGHVCTACGTQYSMRFIYYIYANKTLLRACGTS